MRKRTPAISFAMAWNAPPSTRSEIGSTSIRCRLGGPGWRPTSYSITDMSDLQCLGGLQGLGPGGPAGRDEDVSVLVDRRGEAGWDRRGRVVLMHDRWSLKPVPRLQECAVVAARGYVPALAANY